MIVAGDRVAQWVSNKLNFGLCPPYYALGVEVKDKIICGVVLNNFEGNSVHMTVAGKGWSPQFMRAFGHYVFNQLGCGRITAVTEQPSVVKLAEKLGGEVEGRLREHFGPGRDAIVIGILQRDWKYSKVPAIQRH